MIHVSWKILKREKGMYNEKIKYSNQSKKSIIKSQEFGWDCLINVLY